MRLLKKGVKTFVLLFTKPSRIRFLLGLSYYGYFVDVDFFNSLDANAPVGKNNEKLPWLTYSLISFLELKMTKDMKVFEYGSGYSTHYFAKRCHSVTSVEHHQGWFDIVKKDLPSNCTLVFEKLEENGAYCRASANQSEKFDIILVDGRDRNNCIIQSVNALSPNGIIIVDDSNRDRYQAGQAHLESIGFKKIDFWGPAPSTFNNKSSSVFYRKENCFDI